MLKIIVLLCFIILSLTYSRSSFDENDKEFLQSTLKQILLNKSDLPNSIKISNENYEINYHINTELEENIKKLFKRYHPDYGAMVIIDNNSGNIISAVDFQRKTKSFGRELCFSNNHPAASVFKVITAADLLENTEISSESTFTYRGSSSTLYKYQLKDKVDRWTRELKLEKAFASSNNVVFGKAAINKSNGKQLYAMANKFKFNQELLDELKLEESLFQMPEDAYNLAELASGFNRGTVMSPLHGAVIASIVANDGVYKKPSLISSIKDDKGNTVWHPIKQTEEVLKTSSSKELQNMMELTIEKGTARSLGKYAKRPPLSNLVLGGKTGSITGGEPHGKRDWFIVYAKPKQQELGRGISVAVMLVNVDKWYVKSTWLAKNVIEYYYQNLFPLREKL